MMLNSCKATRWYNNYNHKWLGWNQLLKPHHWLDPHRKLIEKLYRWLSVLINFINETGYKDGHFIGFFHLPEKLANRKLLYQWTGLLTIIKCVVKEAGSELLTLLVSVTIVWRLQMHIHMCITIFVWNWKKSGLLPITWCKKDLALLST